MTWRLLFLTVLLPWILGCASPAGEPYVPPSSPEVTSPLREPTDSELKELVDLVGVVVRGIVQEQKNAPEGVNYVVQVQEVLAERSSIKGDAEFPHAVGDEIRVSAFLYRPGRPMELIGTLKEPNRYLFFLSSMERAGWWLNFDDPAGYPLPDADKTLQTLRAWRDGARPKDGKGE